MNKVICFGELLLRMSPVLQGEWIRQASIPVYVGGAELNAATALARWQVPTKYCTALPAHYLSKEIVNELGVRNIDATAIHFSGKRIGIYFLPQGADLKHASVIYDREYSSFAALTPGMLDWEKILENVSWFHFSAISPALSEETAEVCREALKAASKKNITISVDLNYRPLLWQYTHHPPAIMRELVNYCDLVMGNIWSANTLLGITVDEQVHTKGKKADYLDHAKQTSIAIQQQFPKCKTVANTFRFDHQGNGMVYYATLRHGNVQYDSHEFIAHDIVDKVGSGDCFMAGLIYGFYHHHDPGEIINLAAAAAFGKFFEKGDATRQDIADLRSRLKNYG